MLFGHESASGAQTFVAELAFKSRTSQGEHYRIDTQGPAHSLVLSSSAKSNVLAA